MDGQTDDYNGQQVITIAHPEPCSDELKNYLSYYFSVFDPKKKIEAFDDKLAKKKSISICISP